LAIFSRSPMVAATQPEADNALAMKKAR
jgi:hypothetical protein